MLDIDANAVEDVILTHLHYDHVGNFDRFPKARFHLQERELAYATGRYMRYPRLSHSFEVEGRLRHRDLLKRYAAARNVLRWRRAETCAWLDNYAAGEAIRRELQFVRVRTARGFVVLASDVCSFLREHGKQPAIHGRLPYRRNAGGF